MELSNTFDVAAEPGVAWRTVGDLEQIALCLPGAVIESRDGDTYHGRVQIKVGPIAMGMSGVATVVERDDPGRRMTVQIRAEDAAGQGTVEATMAVSASPSPAGTTITIATTMQLGGKVAQFGSGLITQVSGRIVKQVAKRIGALVEAGPDGPADTPAAGRPAPSPADPLRLPLASALPLAAATLAGALFGWSLGRSLRRSSR